MGSTVSEAEADRQRIRGALTVYAVHARIRAALFGLVVGEAEVPRLESVSGQQYRASAMAIELARSLIEQSRFDPNDWQRRTRREFGINADLHTPVMAYLAPVVCAYLGSFDQAIEAAEEVARTVYGVPESVDTCAYFAALLFSSLTGIKRDHGLLRPDNPFVQRLLARRALCEPVMMVIASDPGRAAPDSVGGATGIARALGAALRALAHAADFRDGLLLLGEAGLGRDAGMRGAIYGQLAGPYFGLPAIPQELCQRLDRHDEIQVLARALFRRALSSSYSGDVTGRQRSD